MIVAAIIQARMGSTRLPGKVMRRLDGSPVLAHIARRLAACERIDRIAIATTTEARDEAIAVEAARLGLFCFRGSEDDVLGRYVGAARRVGADVVVRITADCPLVDPDVVDRILEGHATSGFDYASNTIRRTYPQGLDAEAVTRSALERLDAIATPGPAREHVTWLVHQRPTEFTRLSIEDTADNSDLRWTLDTEADWRLIERLYLDLGLAGRPRPYPEVLSHVRAHPALIQLNAHIQQKSI
jgi:spore coat polysaccharide biosynthesis protein SpsF